MTMESIERAPVRQMGEFWLVEGNCYVDGAKIVGIGDTPEEAREKYARTIANLTARGRLIVCRQQKSAEV